MVSCFKSKIGLDPKWKSKMVLVQSGGGGGIIPINQSQHEASPWPDKIYTTLSPDTELIKTKLSSQILNWIYFPRLCSCNAWKSCLHGRSNHDDLFLSPPSELLL